MSPDNELLGRYCKTRSDEAFSGLVACHINLVHSTALRQVGGDVDLAKDVAQIVFTDLARKANTLSKRSSLTGWLYTSTLFTASTIVRRERRRREREEKLMQDPIHESASQDDWEEIRPFLDDGMRQLKEADREAILLRYFEDCPFAEVGSRLGLSENAVRMRVERALEKLRLILARRRITSTATLVSVISANAVQAAPSGLAAACSTAAVTAATTGSSFAFLNLMTMTKLNLGLTALVVAGATTVFVQHRQQEQLRLQNESMRQEIVQLQNDNGVLSNRLGTAGEPNAIPEQPSSELLRLRGELGLLQRQKTDLEDLLAKQQHPQPRNANTQASQPPPSLPEDYPKTPEAATQGIFAALSRGDFESFLTNFTEPGVPHDLYAQMFTEEMRSNFVGTEIVGIGQPTNWLATSAVTKWFVPYTIRLPDGTQKKFRLSIGQHAGTQRYYFDGGL
jgi:RNA polymerase sigma factor (sigma-70 family)